MLHFNNGEVTDVMLRWEL